MIEPNQRIPVTLDAAQWQTVLIQLGEGPYRVVAPLIQAIAEQCQRHDTDNVTPFPKEKGGA